MATKHGKVDAEVCEGMGVVTMKRSPIMVQSFRLLFMWGLVAIIFATTPPPLSAEQSTPDVTFSKDIVPILQRSCERCHRPGGGAPMTLITYRDVRPWARSIKQRTMAGEMPPWFIDKNIGIQRFKDDPSLSDAEIAVIGTWVDAGAPQGNPSDMPPARVWPAGKWTIGEPDLIISSPITTIDAVAADWFGGIGPPSPVGLTEDRYIKAVEVKEVLLDDDGLELEPAAKDGASPGEGRAALNLFVVHHAVINAEANRNEEDTPGRGPLGNFSITHELGQNATYFPEHLGVRLPADSVLTYDRMHFHSVGKEVRARVDTAFKLHPKNYKPKYLQGFGSQSGAFDLELDIPAGEDNIMRDGFYRVTRPAILMTFEPHLHSSGRRMCIEALYPNNAREMLNCADYNHNWVKVYSYEDDAAPLLPAGTVLHLLAWYDNSPSNPQVLDPRNWKGWGNRSIDDMLYHLPRMTFLTDEQFEEEVAARGVTQQFATSQNQ
jgi:hypothetical protein